MKTCGSCHWWEENFGCCCAASPLRSKIATATCDKHLAKAITGGVGKATARFWVNSTVQTALSKRPRLRS